ncbi:hypothetical protein COF68_04600 [Bacillus toyonensis]|uniref:hypothetical protein n=1 Tax=Bacillus toyonensis TaxID=155322 RepID=UPI000BFC0668|nr:hypothetical protein [Bacillus toyonensis]PHE64134.1 hypothetical protein COF68_04600 [Bacillus toyonensis]
MNICEFEGCNQPKEVDEYCSEHYITSILPNLNEKEKSTLLGENKVKLSKIKLCSVENCNKPHSSKGYCSKHYHQVITHGRVLTEQEERTRTCTVEWCNKRHALGGYCKKHYKDVQSHGVGVLEQERKEIMCSVEGCNNRHTSNGLCAKHYFQSKTLESDAKIAKQPVKDTYEIFKTLRSKNSTSNTKVEEQPKKIATSNRVKLSFKAELTPQGHVYQEGKTLDVLSDEYAKKQEGYSYKVCSVISCETLVLGKGCCRKHLAQFKKSGTLTNDKDSLCNVVNCGRALYKEGYCQSHYENWKIYGVIPPKEEIAPLKVCRIRGCKEERIEEDLCKTHYEQFLEYEKAEKERLEKKAESDRLKQVERKFKEEALKVKLKEAEESRRKREEDRKIKAKNKEENKRKREEQAKLNAEKRELERVEKEKRKEQRRLESIANYIYEEGITLDISSKEYKDKQESLDYKPCIVVDCIRKMDARGCCKKHYHKHLTTGSLAKLPRKNAKGTNVKEKPICSVESCNTVSKTKGYCGKHYRQIQVHGRLTPELEVALRDPICKAEGCKRERLAKGYCRKHYAQVKNHGRLTPELERGNN